MYFLDERGKLLCQPFIKKEILWAISIIYHKRRLFLSPVYESIAKDLNFLPFPFILLAEMNYFLTAQTGIYFICYDCHLYKGVYSFAFPCGFV